MYWTCNNSGYLKKISTMSTLNYDQCICMGTYGCNTPLSCMAREPSLKNGSTKNKVQRKKKFSELKIKCKVSILKKQDNSTDNNMYIINRK